ncbi:electron transfer flavoprotein subunit beta [Thermanaerosceptrum fracticalcis]|jgi:electron transfer flavoprotein beta subunit|uniref:Electron transfer flavoprotein small subunit n=1 Tax=Thermanaerosceptrum fracticalcis TaxID=1712410 RepID=A0A7G6E3T0_THEFR|nr:electron transfer flavoprotein subunit beta/FixA family protein [Thermanaerosceptrum fracticalcis]QNB46734.1 electron transfer flavoprotein subunit beta [Thermanaerosceptrum fracticalcis]
MNIVVCIKQVPDTTEVKTDPKTGTLIRDGVPSIINPEDKNALEAALVLKEQYGAKVIVLTMGPPQADDALKEALAMGADEAILISDRAFAGADTLATSTALGNAIRKIGNFSVIFCGRQAIDGDTAQVGPQLAEYLNIPQVTYVKDIQLFEGKVQVKRALEDGFEVIEAQLPVLLTVIKDLNEPRYPSIKGIVDAYRSKQTTVWSAADLGANLQEVGLKGSPTQVRRIFTPAPKGKGEMLQGQPQEMICDLISRLKNKKVV